MFVYCMCVLLAYTLCNGLFLVGSPGTELPTGNIGDGDVFNQFGLEEVTVLENVDGIQE